VSILSFPVPTNYFETAISKPHGFLEEINVVSTRRTTSAESSPTIPAETNTSQPAATPPLTQVTATSPDVAHNNDDESVSVPNNWSPNPSTNLPPRPPTPSLFVAPPQPTNPSTHTEAPPESQIPDSAPSNLNIAVPPPTQLERSISFIKRMMSPTKEQHLPLQTPSPPILHTPFTRQRPSLEVETVFSDDASDASTRQHLSSNKENEQRSMPSPSQSFSRKDSEEVLTSLPKLSGTATAFSTVPSATVTFSNALSPATDLTSTHTPKHANMSTDTQTAQAPPVRSALVMTHPQSTVQLPTDPYSCCNQCTPTHHHACPRHDPPLHYSISTNNEDPSEPSDHDEVATLASAVPSPIAYSTESSVRPPSAESLTKTLLKHAKNFHRPQAQLPGQHGSPPSNIQSLY
jgi:hypothetical protein